MFKPAILSVALLAGCSNGAELRTGDYMDALTTTALPMAGLVEGNPLLAPTGQFAGLAALALKYGVKSANIRMGRDVEETNAVGDNISWIGACWNTMLIAGAAPPLALTAATLCYVGASSPDRE